MLVDCPGCARSYHVSTDEIGERGRVVICPRCAARWFLRYDQPALGASLNLQAEMPGDRPQHYSSNVQSSHHRLTGMFRPLLAAGLCVGLVGGTVRAREPIVRMIPRTAALYAAAGLPVNVRGLEIQQLAPAQMTSTSITVAGKIRNVTGRRVSLPRVAFEIRDVSGKPLLSWSESLPQRSLGEGQVLAFASAPHDLPPDSRTVFVRFEAGGPPAALSGPR